MRYAQWRRESAEPGRVPEYEDIDEKGAARLITRLLSDGQGRTLDPDRTCDLLAAYGIHVHRALPAPTLAAATEAARTIGYPVALKATAPHLRHRADLGGVRLDLADEGQLRHAYTELTELFGGPEELRPVVQGMAPRGVDTVVRAVIDPAAGAVLSFGLAGAASQLLGDTAHRLVPVTDRDASSLVRAIRTAPLLFGWRGSAPWTPRRWRNSCCACPVWSTTTPRSSPSPWNRSWSPRTGPACSAPPCDSRPRPPATTSAPAPCRSTDRYTGGPGLPGGR